MTAGLLGIGLATWIAPTFAQGPLWDVVHVNLPYTVTVGDKTLEPGEYEIRQNHDSGGGAKVLLIYSDKGMKFETSAMTIPALDPSTARETQVILSQVDNDYYMSKVWIQGKDYGYQFPVPDKFKAREKEHVAAVNVPATFSASKSESTTMANSSTTAATDNTIAQTTPAKTDEQVAVVTPVNPPVSSTPTYADANSANREVIDQAPATTPTPATPERMPATSAGWLMMLLGGGSISGIGLALRRKRQ